MNSKARARQILAAEYGDSSNFMTPDLEGVELVGTTGDGHTLAVEKSRGTFMGDKLYAASFAAERPDGTTTRLTGLSGVFASRGDRAQLIRQVRETVEEAESLPIDRRERARHDWEGARG